MMQPTDLWERNHAASVGGLDLPGLRAIHLQGQMRSPGVVVGEVISEDPRAMSLVDHDHVIETVASDRPDQPFDVGILPWGSCRGEHLFEAAGRDPLLEGFAVDLVPVTQRVLGRILLWECFHDLLRGPRRRRVRGHVAVDHTPPVMGEQKEDEEDLVPNGRENHAQRIRSAGRTGGRLAVRW
jgi:hypothetical protein